MPAESPWCRMMCLMLKEVCFAAWPTSSAWSSDQGKHLLQSVAVDYPYCLELAT